MGVTRRAVLGWGLAAAGVGVAGIGGLAVTGNLDRAESSVRRRLEGDGPSVAPPEVPTGGLVTGTFPSPAMEGADVGYAVSYPPGSRSDSALPVVLELYGRGGNHLTPFDPDNLALNRFQSAVIAAGSTPFAVATVDGGPASYWHRRASGIDPQRMILDEYLPLLAARGLLVDRIALLGESMGGYGALLLAERIRKERTAAVAVYAPAIFRSAEETAAGSFDGAEDWDTHDVGGHSDQLLGIPIRIVCGTLDPFYDTTRALVRLGNDPPVETSYERAGHSPGYWRTETAAQLRFLAHHLAAVRTPSAR